MSGMWAKMRKNLLQMPIDSKEDDFTQIEDNLYLGNISFAQNQHSMNKYNISLIIGVYPKNLINIALQMIPSNCRFHHINVKDSPSEDLISHFDKCFDLITEEIDENGGNVFVFCGAGISRSATIVASYLMRKHSIGCDEAIERIKALRRKINPNQGFLGQLKLYEEMGCRLVRTNPEYRLFSLLVLKKSYKMSNLFQLLIGFKF